MPRTYKFLPTLENLTVRHRGYMPHWEAPGATYSVTFRLRDSLPRGLITQLLQEKRAVARAITGGLRKLTVFEAMHIREEIERRVDEALDRNHGCAYMTDRRIADLVAGALTCFDGQRYELDAWAVMPNHVHAVVRPLGGWQLATVIHSWKSWTSKRINEILRRRGRVWQREYWDRICRDEEDLSNTILYVLNNPEKAGLKDWVWTSRAGWKPADRPAGSRRST